MKFHSWMVLASVAMLCSCVPNKKLVIAQDKSLKRSQDQVYEHQFAKQRPECLLVKGDLLNIEVTYVDLLNDSYLKTLGSETNHGAANGYTVSDSGSIQLPMLGALVVEGLSLSQAEQLVLSKARSIYSQPSVKINFMETQVTVLGEVLRPGRYQSAKCGTSILEVLAQAGGTANMADLEEVKVIRERGDSTQVFFLDLTDEKLLSDPRHYLVPSDVVFVKPLKRKAYTFQESQQIFRGLGVMLSVGTLYIAIRRLES